MSKVFSNDDFRYYSVTIERPLRLRSQMTAIACDELLYDSKKYDLSRYIYETYGSACFSGLSEHVMELREYFSEQEIKVTDKQLEALINTKKWNERKMLVTIATALLREAGTNVWMDYNLFFDKLKTAAKKVAKDLDTKISDAQIKAIARAMSVADPAAEPVIKKQSKGITEYEPDTDLRDTEKIPVSEDIQTYFDREVLPYVADAWIDWKSIVIGCEISFNKYFYKPVPLRTLEENEKDILALDKESQGFIDSLLNSH